MLWAIWNQKRGLWIMKIKRQHDTMIQKQRQRTLRQQDTLIQKERQRTLRLLDSYTYFASKSSPRFPVCRRSIVGDGTVEAKNTLNFISWWRKARIWKFMQPAPKLGVFQRLQSGPSNKQQACIASNQLQTDPKVISINWRSWKWNFGNRCFFGVKNSSVWQFFCVFARFPKFFLINDAGNPERRC